MLTLLIYILLSVTVAPCFATCYGLTVAECDGDPMTGAFGPMHKYPNELAMTRDYQRELGLEPGDMVMVLCTELELCGVYWFWDRMPGAGRRVDLQVDGSNWSGDATIISWRMR